MYAWILRAIRCAQYLIEAIVKIIHPWTISFVVFSETTTYLTKKAYKIRALVHKKL